MAAEATRAATLSRIKTDLRITHNCLDLDIDDVIEACLKDLAIVGVENADEADPAILAAIKLYCRANYEDDTVKADAYMTRYNSMKATLMMASGYGGSADE